MIDTEQTFTRYLLGELSETERTALEEKYFGDSQLFDQLLKTENDLLDDYARGRLSSPLRQRLEQRYLAHPERRGRLKFAEALIARLGDAEQANPSAVAAPSALARLRASLRAGVPTLAFSTVLAALLICVVGLWFLADRTARLRRELNDSQSARGMDQQRERELQQQVTGERQRAEQLSSELERLRSELQTVHSTSQPPGFASLILTIGGVRGAQTGPPATLVIPQGVLLARFHLNLKDNVYRAYVAEFRSADGRDIVRRAGLRAQGKVRARLSVLVPANKFPDGDYVLTLKGVTPEGELEDISKSLFRVEKK